MMTPGQRRAARRAATAGIAAAVTWGVTGLPGKALLRGPLGLIAVAVIGNLAVQAKVSAKAYATEQRLNAHITATSPAVALVANGGTIGGALHVTGAVSAAGTTGVGGQGSVMGNVDGDGDMGTISGSQTLSGLIGNCNTILGQVNDVKHSHNALVTDVQACVNRVNDLLAALG